MWRIEWKRKGQRIQRNCMRVCGSGERFRGETSELDGKAKPPRTLYIISRKCEWTKFNATEKVIMYGIINVCKTALQQQKKNEMIN